MEVDKSIRLMEWPPAFESTNHNAWVTLNWPEIGGEQLLVVTFIKNSRWYGWRENRNFRLVCSKKNKAAAILFEGARAAQRYSIYYALRDIGAYPTSATYKISKADEKALAKWLGITNKLGTNHGIPALCEWASEAMKEEEQRQRDKRGELREEDYLLCPNELPEGLIQYIERSVLPYDDVLIYKKGNVRGTCYACRQEVRATRYRFRQGERVRCPNCGTEVWAYLGTSDRFRVDYVEDIVTPQKAKDGKTIFLRQWHLKRDPTAQWNNIPAQLEEICRYAIRGDRVAKWQLEGKNNWYGNAQRYALSTMVASSPE